MLSALSGRDVRLTTRVDAEILGGMIVRIGDRVMDGSTRSRLRAMRRELAERR
jgi:F-type H+-transporting ATPase subunit delta